MDYAERGTVEKTLDRLIEDGEDFGPAVADEIGQLVDDDEYTPEGRAYVTGVLSGVLATVRTFSENDTEFESEDFEEVVRIADGRATELIRVLTTETE